MKNKDLIILILLATIVITNCINQETNKKSRELITLYQIKDSLMEKKIKRLEHSTIQIISNNDMKPPVINRNTGIYIVADSLIMITQ